MNSHNVVLFSASTRSVYICERSQNCLSYNPFEKTALHLVNNTEGRNVTICANGRHGVEHGIQMGIGSERDQNRRSQSQNLRNRP